MESLVVVFTRWPEPGSVKTRLIPAIGAEGAAELHRAMTEHTMRQLSGMVEGVEVRFDGGDEPRMRAWLGPTNRYASQGSGDLGARMSRAICEGFSRGAGEVVLIGTDCPERERSDFDAAFEALQRADVVFGPTADGGYHLVGVRLSAKEVACPGLFDDIPWGGADVLRESLARAGRLGLSCRCLRVLADVDRPEDLAACERALKKGRP